MRYLESGTRTTDMKKQTTIPVIFFITLFFFQSQTAVAQKQQGLLWRIQKEGGKPSFLFGTMHISDKKAFQFIDSLYIYLRQADAFASEFNPDSANQILTAHMYGEYERPSSVRLMDPHPPAVDTASYILPPDTLPELLKTAVNDTSVAVKFDVDSLAIPGDESSQGLFDKFFRQLSFRRERDPNLMNTFMDAYLYEMAKGDGKQIFGLEDLAGKGRVIDALYNGAKTQKIVSKFQSWDAQGEESPIHRLYLKEDLDSLMLYYTEFFDEAALDIFLYKRNREMVERMKDIMNHGSLFAAVGAAHLPGEKGMLQLLRDLGFNVEPVFSARRMPASEFQPGLNKRTWHKYARADYGFEFQLPGIGKEQNGIKGREVVYHYDIGGGLVFITNFGRLWPTERGRSLQQVVSSHLDEWLSNMGGRVISRKTIEVNGLNAVEAICMLDQQGFYRYREIVNGNRYHIFLLGSEKRENLTSEMAETYLSSFKVIDTPKPVLSEFTYPVEGFSVKLPGEPHGYDVPLDSESAGKITLRSYSWFDAGAGIRYLVSPGKSQTHQVSYDYDPTFFEGYEEVLNHYYPWGISFRDTTIQDHPGRIFSGESDGQHVKGIIIKRGNTWYHALAEFESIKESQEVDRFLQSFRLVPFKKPGWSMQAPRGAGFSVWSPAVPVKDDSDTLRYDWKKGNQAYYAFDPYAAITYKIEKHVISPYFWSPSIDSVYELWKTKLINKWRDSLAVYNVTTNGSLQGREFTGIDTSTRKETMYRTILNGDTMFVLSVTKPKVYADEENINRFFESFKVQNERGPDIVIKRGPTKLFADLQSADSATLDQAYSAIDEVTFYETDIQRLAEQSILKYRTPENKYLTINEKLFMELIPVFTSSSRQTKDQVIEFIRKAYLKDEKNIDSHRFDMLAVIASDSSKESYQVVRELLGVKKKRANNSYLFFSKLKLLPGLSCTLYPDLLGHISDTTMGLQVIYHTRTLVDSSLLSADIFRRYKTDLLKLARWQQLKLKKEDYYDGYYASPLIETLRELRMPDADQVLAGYLKVKDNNIKSTAAVALIKNGRTVPATVIKAIAAELETRAGFYESLERIGKGKLVPQEFRSQISMAESYVFRSYFDDEEGYAKPEIIYIRKVDREYKGEKRRFYLFRLNIAYEGEAGEDGDEPIEKESYLAIAGPFDTNPAKICIDEKENICGAWYQERFDGMKSDYYFEQYLRQRLEWQK